jgi:hypothetical protein
VETIEGDKAMRIEIEKDKDKEDGKERIRNKAEKRMFEDGNDLFGFDMKDLENNKDLKNVVQLKDKNEENVKEKGRIRHRKQKSDIEYIIEKILDEEGVETMEDDKAIRIEFEKSELELEIKWRKECLKTVKSTDSGRMEDIGSAQVNKSKVIEIQVNEVKEDTNRYERSKSLSLN